MNVGSSESCTIHPINISGSTWLGVYFGSVCVTCVSFVLYISRAYNIIRYDTIYRIYTIIIWVAKFMSEIQCELRYHLDNAGERRSFI